MLAKPEGIEAQFFCPFGHSENFLVILLVRAAQLGVIVAENKNAKLHVDAAPPSNRLDGLDSICSYLKAKEISILGGLFNRVTFAL